MEELQELRARLDETDRQIVHLFEERMRLTEGVARYKLARGLPVLDASREEAVLDSRASWLADPALDGDVRELYRAIMAISRAGQEKLIREAKAHA